MSYLKTYIKPGDKVFCHRGMVSGYGDEIELTPGKWYEITHVYEEAREEIFAIRNDVGHAHKFVIDTDNVHTSYSTWFYTDKEIREKQIDILLNE